MLKIETDIGLEVTIIEEDDDGSAYEQSYACLLGMVKDSIVTRITASGEHLQRIRELLVNIPGPRFVYPDTKFTWTGDFAKTIVANIMNSLYNSSSFIVNTVEDYNEQRTRRSTTDNHG